jgi:hypothetical protein
MDSQNKRAMTEENTGLSEVALGQFAEVSGGYQPVYVNPAIIAEPFNMYWASPHLGVEPSHGIPYCQK